MTQFGRALNIEVLFANSSQAKGRVERANWTLQDRLVKELRLATISDMEAANAFLPSFTQRYNAKFAKAPRRADDLHYTFGKWEGDLMIFERAQGKSNGVPLVERKTRYAVLFRTNNRSTTHLRNRLMRVMDPLPQPARCSITFDRGIEFRDRRKHKPRIGPEA